MVGCPFAVLGLHPDASAAEVNRQFKALMLKSHPDKSAEDTTDLAKALNEARGLALEICGKRPPEPVFVKRTRPLDPHAVQRRESRKRAEAEQMREEDAKRRKTEQEWEKNTEERERYVRERARLEGEAAWLRRETEVRTELEMDMYGTTRKKARALAIRRKTAQRVREAARRENTTWAEDYRAAHELTLEMTREEDQEMLEQVQAARVLWEKDEGRLFRPEVAALWVLPPFEGGGPDVRRTAELSRRGEVYATLPKN